MNDEQVEILAEAAYLAEIDDPKPWCELPRWIKEAWRCEVDENRDTRNILKFAWEDR